MTPKAFADDPFDSSSPAKRPSSYQNDQKFYLICKPWLAQLIDGSCFCRRRRLLVNYHLISRRFTAGS
ncbi:MAG: hypothetical protein DMF47_05225 [Verrucomicrobia bacterium]|nr:MAG: hypothetical protein DMF47_05225 [Verrucomicrobiota bacterium]PYL84924.1 MAG: hypothetical protein DMF17_10155 [Verrucomicrobiota bacterium]